MVNVSSNLNRQPFRRSAYRVRKFFICLVVNQKHGGLGNLGRPPVEFEAVELANGEFLFPLDIERHSGFTAALADSDNDVCFNPAQFPIRQK